MDSLDEMILDAVGANAGGTGYPFTESSKHVGSKHCFMPLHFPRGGSIVARREEEDQEQRPKGNGEIMEVDDDEDED